MFRRIKKIRLCDSRPSLGYVRLGSLLESIRDSACGDILSPVQVRCQKCSLNDDVVVWDSVRPGVKARFEVQVKCLGTSKVKTNCRNVLKLQGRLLQSHVCSKIWKRVKNDGQRVMNPVEY